MKKQIPTLSKLKKIIYFFGFTAVCLLYSNAKAEDFTLYTFRLLPPPSVSISPLPDVCENATPFTLANGSPVGGIYSGPGVIGNIFNPSKAGVGTYAITYTIYILGAASSASTTITVNPVPVPDISGDFANCQDSSGFGLCVGNISASVCENSNGTYSTPNNAGSSYSWIVGGGIITSGQNTSTVTINWGSVGTGTLKVIETNSFGCSDTVEMCIIIKPSSGADFSASTACLGIATQFTDLSSGSPLSWYWNFGDGTTSTVQNPDHIFASGGSYTVSLIVKGKCDCADTIVKTITVNSSPGPKIICPSTVCADSSATYSTDANCSTYNWSVTGGTIIAGQNTNQILVDWGAGPVGTISLSTSGCTSANCTTPTTVTIPIIPASITINGSATPCRGAINNYSLPVFPGSVYNWSIVPASAGSITTGQGTTNINVYWNNSATNAAVNVTVGNAFIGCQVSASLPVKILPFIYIWGTTVCKGSNSTITPYPVPTSSINWTISGGTIMSGQGTATLTVNWNTPAGTYTVTATPASGNYCNPSSSTIFTVIDVPPVDSISGQQYICPGSTYAYNAWSSTAGVTYHWTAVNGTVSSATGNPISVTWGASGPYSVSVTQGPVSPVCLSSPVTLTANSMNITPPPVIGSQTVCVNGINTYNLPDIPGAAYSWSLNPASAGSIIAGQGSNSVQIQYDAPGAATISVSITYCATPVITSLAVLVNPAPAPAITVAGVLCSGSSVMLSSGGAFPNYQWQDGTLTIIGTTSAINISSPGVYILTVTNSNGCQGKVLTAISSATGPMASISTPDKKDYCIGDVINTQFYALVGPGYAYQWYFNGSAAGTGNSLTAAAAGSYSVLVTNGNGCTKASSVIDITQVSCSGGGGPGNPLPGGGSPEPADIQGNGAAIISTQLFCTNVINYTDNSTNTASNMWFWDFGDGSTSALQNPTHIYAEAGYYYVSFYVKFNNGNIGEVHKSIEIPIIQDFDSDASCGTATFTDLSTHTPTSPITSWSWDFGDASSSSLQNPTHTYAAPGAYPVTLSVTAGGCAVPISKNVVIDTFPVAQFSFPISCAGTPTPFTDGSTGSTIIFWSWNFGDGTSSQLQNPAHTYISNGTYTVTLTITDINGCTSASSQSITIAFPIGAGAITASGPTMFCSGQFVILTAPAAASYLWSNGSTLQAITVNQSGIYSVITFSAGGCSGSPPPITVVVKPAPDVTLSNLAGSICNGSSFYSYVLDHPSGYTYQWYNGSIATGSLYYIYTPNPGVYHVVVTNSAGCSAASVSVTVSVLPAPTAPVITGSATFCQGSTTTLTANSSGGTPPLTYQWTPSSQPGNSIVVSNEGYYSIFVTDKNGCNSYSSKSATINPLPDLSIFPVGCYTRCSSETIFGPPGYASYQWQLNGVNFSTAQSIVATTSGTYNLIVSTSFGCVDTSGKLNLTIAPLPIANAGLDVTLCTGGTQLTGSGGIIYTWSPPAYLSNPSVSNPTSTPTTTTHYQLEVTDINGCKDIDSVTVALFPSSITISPASICAGDSALLTATGGGTYLWSTGATTSSIYISPMATTNYTVLVTNGSCSVAGTATVTVSPIPVASAGNNVTITEGSSIILSASGGENYVWSNGATSAVITVAPLVTTVYCVAVTDANNCVDSACVTVSSEPDACSLAVTGELYIPNAFSPNNDGENDVIKIYYGNYACIKTFKFVIYNRWGEKVFETKDTNFQWDGVDHAGIFKGTALGTAVFVYYMRATLISGEEISKKGNISLIR